MRNNAAALLMGLGIICSSTVWAENARDQLDCFADGLNTLQADFTQVIVDADGLIVEESQGRLWLEKPNHFRWDYAGDFPQHIVADGDKVWIHDVELEQVTVKEQSQLAANSPLMVLLEPSDLEQQFTVTELGTSDTIHWLSLQPAAEQSEFERVLLGFSSNQLKSMILEDAFGQRTRIDFASMQRNLNIEAHRFSFQPPEGVDLIGAEEL